MFTSRLFLIVLLLLGFALPAQAHTRAQLDEWVGNWSIQADQAFSPGLLWDLQDMTERHPWYFDPQPRQQVSSGFQGIGSNVEQWRGLVSVYFAAEDVWRVLCLMGHESGGNPNAYNAGSGASGLMQVLSSWADDYGVSKQALFDPNTNLRIAADLKKRFGWTQWSPYVRGECR